jgi:hypothetical protein
VVIAITIPGKEEAAYELGNGSDLIVKNSRP